MFENGSGMKCEARMVSMEYSQDGDWISVSSFDDSCKFMTFFLQMNNRSQKRKRFLKTQTKESIHRDQESSESKQFDITVYQKFVEFLNRNRLQKLKERITYFYGRNFPIDYNPKYDFKERWEDLKNKDEKRNCELYEQYQPIQIGHVTIMFINVLVIWSLTVKRFFLSSNDKDDLSILTCAFGCLGTVISGLIKIYLKHKQLESGLTMVKTIKVIFWNLLALAFYVLYLLSFNVNSFSVIAIEVIVIFNLYKQARKIYKRHGFIHLSLRYEEKFKIFDSMINLIIVAHFCSLALYAATWNEHTNSWIISAGVSEADYITRYIYSFYFCSTTILTVGYGDVAPKNIKEILVVTIIQFFGVIIFGYLINEIGHTLSIMRKNEEGLEKDLRTLGRIEKFYNIQENLVSKAKGYLINHQHNIDQLTPQEENRLLGKLNEELRGSIHFQRSLSAIKSSIFFVCRWSKEMQSEMALKLQKLLFAPNERLPQIPGSERIYIIKRGKVDIYIKRFGPNNRDDSRFLKRIQTDESHEISENIYGYTAVISTKKCNLDAVSSDFTSCMYINKEDFQKCINKTNIDREYYHEIKTNLDLSEFCESFEAPSILNIRQHYYPSRTILIRKRNAVYAKLSNTRLHFLRSNRKLKRFNLQDALKIIEQINDKLLSCSDEILDSYERDNTTSVRGTIDVLQDDVIDNIRKSTIINTNLERIRSTSGSIYRGTVEMLGSGSKIEEEAVLKAKFEKAWEYGNYFPYNNLERVLQRLSRQNYMTCKREEIEIQTKKVFLDFTKHH